MNLSDAQLQKLLPLFMQSDEASIGLSNGINELVHTISRTSPVLKKWNQIDLMDDTALDEMAWELNILWYEKEASIEIKRRIVKNSDLVYAYLGTRWAVEEVVSAYLGDAEVQEFWEFSGKAHHFKVICNNPHITTDMEQIFLRALEKVKRKSQWLEAISISLESAGTECVGPAMLDSSTETYYFTGEIKEMSPPPIVKFGGGSYLDTATETYFITT